VLAERGDTVAVWLENRHTSAVRVLATSSTICQIPADRKVPALVADIPKMSSISSVPSLTSLPSAVSSGSAAIASGSQLLNQDAQQIANPNNQDLLDPLTNLSQANLLAEAGADVIRASNGMLGTLLDMFA
jgi:hypothetical protein